MTHGYFKNAIYFDGEAITDFQYSVAIPPTENKDDSNTEQALARVKGFLTEEEIKNIQGRARRQAEQTVYIIRNGPTVQGVLVLNAKGTVLFKTYRLNRAKTIRLIDGVAEKLKEKYKYRNNRPLRNPEPMAYLESA